MDATSNGTRQNPLIVESHTRAVVIAAREQRPFFAIVSEGEYLGALIRVFPSGAIKEFGQWEDQV